ncbi:hypothetical protein GCM10028808_33910 [Spirosoma migulaei]
MSRPNRHILYVSRSYSGHSHDYSVLKAEFNPAQSWFANCRVRLDLGFQGFADDYQCDQVVIAHKRKRVKKGQSNELSVAQKVHNQVVNGQRVAVEHSLSGMKRYRILVNRNRIKVTAVLDRLLGVCAALWNFTIA